MKNKYWSLVISGAWRFALGHWSFRRQAGFTMVELIMVMVILGTLVTIVVAKYPASLDRSRDTQRKSDFKQYQTALESYASRNNGVYPLRDTAGGIRASDNAGNPSLCNDLGLNAGANTDCPADTKDNQSVCSTSLCRYFYRSNGGASTGAAGATVYVLWGALQRPLSPTSNRYFIVCSNGKSGEGPVPSTSACPI
jgi:prepilin-type N-terminal cleavage/methylation domain-containing protein